MEEEKTLPPAQEKMASIFFSPERNDRLQFLVPW